MTREAHELLGRVLIEGQRCRVAVRDEPHPLVVYDDRIRCGLEELSIALLALDQRRMQPDSLPS